MYCAEAGNELAGPVFGHCICGQRNPFEEMLHWRRAVGNTVSDLTDQAQKFEPQTAANWLRLSENTKFQLKTVLFISKP